MVGIRRADALRALSDTQAAVSNALAYESPLPGILRTQKKGNHHEVDWSLVAWHARGLDRCLVALVPHPMIARGGSKNGPIVHRDQSIEVNSIPVGLNCSMRATLSNLKGQRAQEL